MRGTSQNKLSNKDFQSSMSSEQLQCYCLSGKRTKNKKRQKSGSLSFYYWCFSCQGTSEVTRIIPSDLLHSSLYFHVHPIKSSEICIYTEQRSAGLNPFDVGHLPSLSTFTACKFRFCDERNFKFVVLANVYKDLWIQNVSERERARACGFAWLSVVIIVHNKTSNETYVLQNAGELFRAIYRDIPTYWRFNLN